MDQINATMTESELINQTALEADSGVMPRRAAKATACQRGDSFYLIARKFGISVRALMNANPAISRRGRLLVGDILCVPVGEGRSCPVGFFGVHGAAGAERGGCDAFFQRFAPGACGSITRISG